MNRSSFVTTCLAAMGRLFNISKSGEVLSHDIGLLPACTRAGRAA